MLLQIASPGQHCQYLGTCPRSKIEGLTYWIHVLTGFPGNVCTLKFRNHLSKLQISPTKSPRKKHKWITGKTKEIGSRRVVPGFVLIMCSVKVVFTQMQTWLFCLDWHRAVLEPGVGSAHRINAKEYYSNFHDYQIKATALPLSYLKLQL